MKDFLFYIKDEHELTRSDLKSNEQYLNGSDELKVYETKKYKFIHNINTKNGYFHYEDSSHYIYILGTPIYLGNQPKKYDKSYFCKMVLQGLLTNTKIDKILSGPFVVVWINKIKNEVHFITDIMSFIPIYSYKKNCMIVSSHLDTLQKRVKSLAVDPASFVDLLINRTVVYPYTIFRDVYQIQPATNVILFIEKKKTKKIPYWFPKEKEWYKNIKECKQDLKKIVVDKLKNVESTSDNNCVFLSAGEDSRVIISILDKTKLNKAVTFLEEKNLEHNISKDVVSKFNVNHEVIVRKKNHYIENMNEILELIGPQDEVVNAHSFYLDHIANLSSFDNVFGGLKSDTYCKGHSIPKKDSFLNRIFSFESADDNHDEMDSIMSYKKYFDFSVLSALKERYISHIDNVKTFRPKTFNEWYKIWPASMDHDMSNFSVNRRLFNSVEIFLSNDVVKWASKTPRKYRLNRKVFQKAFKPYLKSTKWIINPKGYLPYFSIIFNLPFRSIYKIKRRLLFFRKSEHQGPWPNWNEIVKGDTLLKLKSYVAKDCLHLENIINFDNLDEFLDKMTGYQKMMFYQLLYYFNKEEK